MDLDFLSIAENIAVHGGTTVSTRGEELPQDGYFVSLYGFEQTVPMDENLTSNLAAYVEEYRHHLAHPGRYLGAWVEDGRVVLDVSDWWQYRDTARRAGFERGQRAVFDIARQEAVSVYHL